MANTVPPSLGKPVTTRQFSWAEMARRAWGSEFSAPDHRVYEWSNGRGFDSTDRGETGFYEHGVLSLQTEQGVDLTLEMPNGGTGDPFLQE